MPGELPGPCADFALPSRLSPRLYTSSNNQHVFVRAPVWTIISATDTVRCESAIRRPVQQGARKRYGWGGARAATKDLPDWGAGPPLQRDVRPVRRRCVWPPDPKRVVRGDVRDRRIQCRAGDSSHRGAGAFRWRRHPEPRVELGFRAGGGLGFVQGSTGDLGNRMAETSGSAAVGICMGGHLALGSPRGLPFSVTYDDGVPGELTEKLLRTVTHRDPGQPPCCPQVAEQMSNSCPGSRGPNFGKLDRCGPMLAIAQFGRFGPNSARLGHPPVQVRRRRGRFARHDGVVPLRAVRGRALRALRAGGE